MVDISFGVVVSDITESESKELIDKLGGQGVVEVGDQRGDIHELGYDGDRFHVNYVESDTVGGPNYVFHAASETPAGAGRLMITFDWFHGDAKTRDRVSFNDRFDQFVDIQQNLSSLRDDIRSVSEKEVTVGTIEIR